MLQTTLLCCLCMASCSDIEDNKPILPPDQEQENPDTPDRPQDYTGLINNTYPVPVNIGQVAHKWRAKILHKLSISSCVMRKS